METRMATQRAEDYYEVFWPRGARQQKRRSLARRPTALNGKTIAFAWDYLFRGDEVFATLQGELARRFPDLRFVSWEEIGNTHGIDEREVVADLPRRLKAMGVDMLVSGMGC